MMSSMCRAFATRHSCSRFLQRGEPHLQAMECPRKPEQSHAARPMRLTACLLLIVAGCSASRQSQSQSDGSAVVSVDIASVSLPAPDAGASAAVQKYLEGDGVLLATFRSAIQPLLTVPSQPKVDQALPMCTEVAKVLGAVDPSKLAEKASAVPDDALASLFMDERVLTSKTLVACGSGDMQTMMSNLSRLRGADALIQRRLTELGQ